MSTLRAADLFCGGGGTSEGLARACARAGKDLDLIAVNHWQLAIDTHKKNHPNARHICASLEGLNPRDHVPTGRLKILVASPECTHHSAARGGRPMNDQSRASAWLILKWLQELYVDNILIENVPEFQQWGPLGANGKPLKSKRGVLFQQFIENLRALGYAVDYRVLNAANYGDPTTRERLFILGRRGGKKITWPLPTHARTDKTDTLFGTVKPWRSARGIIDWQVPGKSIFNRKRPLAMNTLKRILAGMQKFKWPEPFIVVLRQHMDARSIDEPLSTVTAGGTHFGLAQPFTLQQQSGGAPRSVDDPVPTVAGSGAISLIMANRTNNVPKSVDEPVPALCTGNHMYKIDPFMVAAGGPEGKGRTPQPVDAPLGTVLTENHTGIVQPFMVPFFGERDGQDPRVHDLRDPLPAVTSHGAGALVEPFIMTASHGEGDSRRCKPLGDPLPTVTCANDHGIVEPFTMRFDHQQGSNAGRARSVDSPLPTITTKNGLAIVEPFLAELRNGKTANSIEDPLSTVTTMGAHHAIVDAEPFIDKFYGSGVAAAVEDPLDTVTAKARFGLCRIGDTLYDIHFRMLRPRELARAQGFPDSYEFAGSGADATKLIGNAVPVGTAEALCWELIA